MGPQCLRTFRLATSLVAIAGTLMATLASAAPPPVVTAVSTLTLNAVADAGTVKSQPTFTAPNSYLVLSKRGNGDFDHNFIQFNLNGLPAHATIHSARLQLHVGQAGGPVDVASGRVLAAWQEATVNWSNQPAVVWNGPVTTIPGISDPQWTLTSLVRNWHSGALPNYGIALRGTNGTGAFMRGDSSESGIAPKLIINYTAAPVSPRDLGDAPDSTNHPGAPMTAYPGVPANYPTVFDPATGLPHGPMHNNPQPFHLGPLVSFEAEADVGPDQDPANNIRPVPNQPNLDRFDDGTNPNTWNLPNCARTQLPVRIFINQQAVDQFKAQNKRGYLNIWFDSNRDGDWADRFGCIDAQGVVRHPVEHIVIDQPINVVSLGPGLHVGMAATGYVLNPAVWAAKPSWVRVTLSDVPSNKPFVHAGIRYGDGRGFPAPFPTGESEDYLRTTTQQPTGD